VAETQLFLQEKGKSEELGFSLGRAEDLQADG
jgi:hypothetical protein